MGSSMKRRASIQKRKEQQKKHRIKIREIIRINSLCSLGLLVICIICIIFSFIVSPEEDSSLSLFLAMISLFVTFSYEIYEWIKLLSKKKENGSSTIPFLISYALIIILTMLKMFTNIWSSMLGTTNIICAITLVVYIVVTTIRTIYCNIKNVK